MVLMPQVRGRPLPHLKAWRMRRYMTQLELAERSGLAKATVTRAETGDNAVSFPNIKKLADALGVSPDELVYIDPDADAPAQS